MSVQACLRWYFYNNITLSMLFYTHFITLDSRHIVVKPLQQSACTWFHWVPDNNRSQSVILRNISYFATYSGVSLQTAVGTKAPVFKESWIWATWVISSVNITLNHHVLSWQRWLIRLISPCSFIVDMDFKELTHGHAVMLPLFIPQRGNLQKKVHVLGEQYIFLRGSFVKFLKRQRFWIGTGFG